MFEIHGNFHPITLKTTRDDSKDTLKTQVATFTLCKPQCELSSLCSDCGCLLGQADLLYSRGQIGSYIMAGLNSFSQCLRFMISKYTAVGEKKKPDSDPGHRGALSWAALDPTTVGDHQTSDCLSRSTSSRGHEPDTGDHLFFRDRVYASFIVSSTAHIKGTCG